MDARSFLGVLMAPDPAASVGRCLSARLLANAEVEPKVIGYLLCAATATALFLLAMLKAPFNMAPMSMRPGTT